MYFIKVEMYTGMIKISRISIEHHLSQSHKIRLLSGTLYFCFSSDTGKVSKSKQNYGLKKPQDNSLQTMRCLLITN